ncbi:MAG: FKBP-type peptidyl-prolyl cis-trans isomerase [Rhodocyclaceae bacterium]|nr:FKBP-type peptidyl-prolyl cis-trans isomerase [Rhodocyclaceae bacterium]
MSQIVQTDSLITLNYRIELDNGTSVIDTFQGTPATLQLGAGEMMPALEACLTGLDVGRRERFTLAPEHAFGDYKPELVERVRREHMAEDNVEAMSVMEFVAPDGSRYQGLVREVDDEIAVIDFNHPLAGKTIAFEVEIIGIL